MSILDRVFGARRSSDPLNAVTFDCSALQSGPEKGNVRIWYTPEGDAVGLYHFSAPPDLPTGKETISEFRRAYKALEQVSEATLLEFDIVERDGCPAVRSVAKVSQEPSGFTYLGALTIPFRDFSYVLKIQCEERAPTGKREALLMDQMLAETLIQIDNAGKIVGDWNPDDEIHDREFPDHPISRLRRWFPQLETTIKIQEETKRKPPFPMPGPEMK